MDYDFDLDNLMEDFEEDNMQGEATLELAKGLLVEYIATKDFEDNFRNFMEQNEIDREDTRVIFDEFMTKLWPKVEPIIRKII